MYKGFYDDFSKISDEDYLNLFLFSKLPNLNIRIDFCEKNDEKFDKIFDGINCQIEKIKNDIKNMKNVGIKSNFDNSSHNQSKNNFQNSNFYFREKSAVGWAWSSELT
jgi:hypothetical protein